MPASSAAAHKLVKLRVTPGSASDVVVKRTLSVPNECANDAAAAELKVLWPDMYAGNGGVSSKEVHFSSPGISRIAVIGRQKSNVNLITQHKTPASARLMFRCANMRAFSARVPRRSFAIACAIMFQCP